MKLNDNEQKIIDILREDPFISQQSIAETMNLSRPAIANLISGLQEKGLILGKPYVLRESTYITCIGSANYDHTFRLVESMVMGTSNPVNSSSSFGGVVRNVAENLARLNQNVSLMTRVGDDVFGENLLSESKKIMEVFASEKVPHETTGGYYSIIDTKGLMVVGYADMSINQLMNRSWILEHKKHIRMSKWVIVDLNVSIEAIEALIELKQEEDFKLAIVGVSGPKMKNLPHELNDVDLLICNKDETQTYFNDKTEDGYKLVNMWIGKGIKHAIVTDGIKGSYFGSNQNIKHQKAYLVPDDQVIDVTGAGDAFSSAVIYGLIHQIPFEEAIKLGAANASLTVKCNTAVNPNISINQINKEIKTYENL
ncbi:MAG TPA: winged helix-turn-helix transcriptional regulator [Acholeplasmataceae bacterium]|nr:winged helix-turn-helix transcriptional regulator [Acholeplasmataceae bacterium]